jgi:hypothetical protein
MQDIGYESGAIMPMDMLRQLAVPIGSIRQQPAFSFINGIFRLEYNVLDGEFLNAFKNSPGRQEFWFYTDSLVNDQPIGL